MFPGELIPLTVPEVRRAAMPTAVAAARQSYADHPMVRLETAPPGPCHAVVITGDAFWDFHRMRDCNIRSGSNPICLYNQNELTFGPDDLIARPRRMTWGQHREMG